MINPDAHQFSTNIGIWWPRVLSQISQSRGLVVVSAMKPLGTHVAICDWRGTVRWISGDGSLPKKGDPLWIRVKPDFLERIKTAFGKVVALQEKAVVEVENVKGRYSRLWMWPLESADMAVCILGMAIPKQLKLLSDRERQVVNLLAQGSSAKQIADTLDISLSSIHTHLRRSREKLDLSSHEELIGFVSRYCQQGCDLEAAAADDADFKLYRSGG